MYKNKSRPSSFIQKLLPDLPTTDSKDGRKPSLRDDRCSQRSRAQSTGSATGLQFRRHGGDSAPAEKPLSTAQVWDRLLDCECLQASISLAAFTTHLGLRSQQSTFSSFKKKKKSCSCWDFLSIFRMRDSEEIDLGTAPFSIGKEGGTTATCPVSTAGSLHGRGLTYLTFKHLNTQQARTSDLSC